MLLISLLQASGYSTTGIKPISILGRFSWLHLR